MNNSINTMKLTERLSDFCRIDLDAFVLFIRSIRGFMDESKLG